MTLLPATLRLGLRGARRRRSLGAPLLSLGALRWDPTGVGRPGSVHVGAPSNERGSRSRARGPLRMSHKGAAAAIADRQRLAAVAGGSALVSATTTKPDFDPTREQAG
jgi:hypothetical protein